jgi:TetR/AcrR family transcriptional regulator
VSDKAAAGDRRPARKQQQRSIVTQQKLLDAAVEAFSEGGFKGTSTRDIADRAGVHHPLITYHFKNKDQLWRAAADRIFREFNVALVKAMAEVPESRPRARAETFIRTYVRYAYKQPALHKFILQESSHPSARLDWLVRHHLKPLFEIVVKSLRELQELGIAPPGDPAILFNMIRVSAGGLLALAEEIKGTSNIDFDAEGSLDRLADMIVRCFLPGAEARQTAVS